MGTKGRKSINGEPELWDEIKRPCTFTLTPTAIRRLEQASVAMGTSRSELVERLARSALVDKLARLEPADSEGGEAPD
jgi:hypothetical protein